MLTPKVDELIATPYRHDGSKEAAEQYFEDGFVDVFASARESQPDDVPMTLFYAFKQSGIWTMMVWRRRAGRRCSRSQTSVGDCDVAHAHELANKIGMKANMLASSVVLACRPRPESAGLTDRQGFLRALREELPGPIAELQKAAIAPVDLRQAAIGPGMAVFSRFAKVVEPDGEPMRVRTALGLINQVLETVLGEQEADLLKHAGQSSGSRSSSKMKARSVRTTWRFSMSVAVDGLVASGSSSPAVAKPGCCRVTICLTWDQW